MTLDYAVYAQTLKAGWRIKSSPCNVPLISCDACYAGTTSIVKKRVYYKHIFVKILQKKLLFRMVKHDNKYLLMYVYVLNF